MSIKRWTDKDVVCIYNGILAIKKNEMPFVALWIELEIIILNEVNQTKKDKYCISLMWILKNDTNELIYRTEIDSENKFMFT